MTNAYTVQNYFSKDLIKQRNNDNLTPMALAAVEGNEEVTFSIPSIDFLDICEIQNFDIVIKCFYFLFYYSII